MDLQLGNALSHPLRIVVLNALTQGAATPQQLAEDLGGSVDPIFYHLRVLTKAGFVRPAKAKQKGETQELHYEVAPPSPSNRNRRLNCTCVVLDERGREEVAAIVDEALVQIAAAQRESAKRLKKAGKDGIDVSVALGSVESHPGESQ